MQRQVDVASLQHRIGGLSRLTRLLPMFTKSYSVDIQTLRCAQQQRDVLEFQKAAHRLRGSLSLLAADEVAKLAWELESGDSETFWDAVEPKIALLERLCELVASELRELPSRPAGVEVAVRPTDRKPGRILVIEDDEMTRTTMREALEGAGHRVWDVESAEQGFQTLAAVSVDCVVMDVMMPGIDGFEACQILKSDPATRMLPVLLVTSLEARADRLRGAQCGADDFITKPVDITQLLLRLSNAVYAKQLFDELQSSFLNLQSLEKLRDTLTHMLVHDLRTPLSSIYGYSKILHMTANSRLSEPEQGYLEQIQVATQSLIEMVTSILDVHRLEANEMPLRREWLPAGELVRKAVEVCFLTEDKTIEVEGDESLLIFCDPSLMHRVVVNLLANALKFSPKRSVVWVIIQTVGTQAELRIRDQGPGIPAALLSKIFDKFGQEEQHRVAQSSGLGLTYCKLVMERHGGSIEVTSVLGHGSDFFLRLPSHP